MQSLIPKVTDHFIKVLTIEVAEKTVSHCLEMLSLWTSQLETDPSKKLIDMIKVSEAMLQFIQRLIESLLLMKNSNSKIREIFLL